VVAGTGVVTDVENIGDCENPEVNGDAEVTGIASVKSTLVASVARRLLARRDCNNEAADTPAASAAFSDSTPIFSRTLHASSVAAVVYSYMSSVVIE